MQKFHSPAVIFYSLLSLFIVSFLAIERANAAENDYLPRVLASMKKGDYVSAIKRLSKQVEANPKDAQAYYYLGNCYEKYGRNKSAVSMYTRAMKYGFKTPMFIRAASRVKAIDPGGYSMAIAAARGTLSRPQKSLPPKPAAPVRKLITGSANGSRTRATSNPSRGSSRASLDSLPPEARIHYRENYGGTHQIIKASVNGKSIEVLFDTGAESCVFGMNHLKQLGIPLPKGRPAGYSQGAGAGGNQPTWIKRIDLKVGPISRRNFVVSILPILSGEPLLGQTFFKDFQYTIDSAGKSIHFIRNDRTASSGRRGSIYGSSNRSEVPFENHGNEIVVRVKVNGRETPMYFDTGASSVTLSAVHANLLGLEIPKNARTSVSHGIAGAAMNFIVPVRTISLGPIEHRNFEVNVTPHMKIPYPLLGQSFFSNYQYQIDNVNKVIKFKRRKR